MNDLFAVIDAGYGTLLFSISSCLLHLKRNPRVIEKLKRELDSSGVKKELFSTKKANRFDIVSLSK